jgi:N-acetylneuraminic acid mutarotase
MPDLPEPVANASAAELGGWLYVAGGDGRSGSVGTFLRIDVARAMTDASARWEVLPGWPGRARYGAMLVAVTTVQGDGLWLGGGIEGPARSQADYLRDAFVYDPTARAWRTAAQMPRGAVMGASVKIDASRLLVLGGSDGHDFQRMRELGEKYRIPGDVLLYDARADRWLPAGTMPLGLVGAAVVRERDGWLVAGGEYTPGLRTPAVYRLMLGGAGATSALPAGKTK